ncbi:hypothetical protein [Bradyrhizobium sp. 190]|uniref:hypothetical protein n=1 Tax=Bradyrhizobium sp. 190 TaxID=2782658 RepID=UPI001FF77BD2|nr:hypothetical protein [Bradyrhizobium sp. 190]
MPANDNEVGNTQIDRIVEIRPSPDEMVRLAAKDAIRAHDGYGPIAPQELNAPMRARLRLDARGQITQWLGGDNRWHETAELFRQPKGKRRKTDEERQADNERHLAIRGSGGFPAASTYRERGGEGQDYRRNRAARWAQTLSACNDNRRREIDRLGVGGGHAFGEAWANAGLPPACRIPRYVTAIAPGAEFLGYRQHRNVTATPGSFVGPASGPEDTIIATMDAPQAAAALAAHAVVLEASLDGLTAREIAAANGWGNAKAGERKAVAAQDRALEALANLAA